MVEHRGEYLAAILTLARGWVNAGMPRDRVRSDSYANWIEGIRGLMAWAGFKGTLGGGDTANVMSDDDGEWYTFLLAVHAVFGERAFSGKELADNIGTDLTWSVNGQPIPIMIDGASLPFDLAEKWAQVARGYNKSDADSASPWAGGCHIGTTAT